ncbi:phosphonate metabolism transcriptional regulator PhnF [Labrys wisconsinensis]|uniref:GntR family phosphonate transport system transcriptional regulator n=1 Tax=Labrys wisconsinensis TaxID=425677 RepID=A0ABU0JAB6_9HYPH|nr:phosphonate metabolism transcriptional regulator PhnF [Labrys wisconsinensis]MDQ0471207.1 GntR family phosphonate transport system transcriptional regulator [Labrys wisconsinensis]
MTSTPSTHAEAGARRGDGVLARGDGVAAWRQIADEIEAEIAAGLLPAGTQLPTEAQLAARFGVNRHTVRRAIGELAARGLVRATQGRGTFVEGGRVPYPIGARTRFSENVARAGHAAGGDLLEAGTVAATAETAAMLRLAPGTPVLRTRIKRFVDGVPVSIATSHMPLPRFAGFVEAFGRTGAITPALAACGVADYRQGESRVSARIASAAEAAELDLAPGRVLMVITGCNVDMDGVPIKAGQTLFAADRMEFVVEP